MQRCVALLALLLAIATQTQSFVWQRLPVTPLFRARSSFLSAEAGPTAGETVLSSKEITRLEGKLEEIKAQLASVREARAQEETELKSLDKEFGGEIARIKKEFARMKERAWEEAAEIDNKAKTDALKEVLPITDNYMRAKSLFVPAQTESETAILAAYDSVFKSFTSVIEGFGVKRVESVGQPFDYNMMEAIMTAPSTEYAKDIVCTEYQIGYRMGDKCVRPAMVVVSVGPGPSTA